MARMPWPAIVRADVTVKPTVGPPTLSGASKPRPSPTSIGSDTSTINSPRSLATTSPSTTPRLSGWVRVIATPLTSAEHAAGEPTAVDLHERRYLGVARWRAVAALQALEEIAIRFRDGRHVLGLFLPPLDLEADDAEIGHCRQMLVRREILG